jgi:UPF0042 nucleotide-binding protein
MVTRVVSFGFKYGAPVDADFVLDVRFLKNPYFVTELRPLSGTDPQVSAYVLSQAETHETLTKLVSLFELVLPNSEREGKSYLTIAVGCTGGRHRSVVVADELGRILREKLGARIGVFHRDVARGESQCAPHTPIDAAVTSDVELKGLLSPPPPDPSARATGSDR